MKETDTCVRCSSELFVKAGTRKLIPRKVGNIVYCQEEDSEDNADNRTRNNMRIESQIIQVKGSVELPFLAVSWR